MSLDYKEESLLIDVFKSLIRETYAADEDISKLKDLLNITKSTLKKNIFRGVYFTIYDTLMSFLELGSVPNANQIYKTIHNNIDVVYDRAQTENRDKLVFKAPIDFMSYTEGTDDHREFRQKEAFLLDTEDTLTNLKEKKASHTEEYKASLEMYIQHFKAEATSELYSVAFNILQTGVKIRGKLLKGQLDSENFSKRAFLELDSIGSMSSGERSLESGAEGLSDFRRKRRQFSSEPVAVSGVSELHAKSDEFKTSEFVTIVGESKAGKTRFTREIEYDGLMKGENVCIFQLEDTEFSVEAMFIAIHLFKTKGIRIPDKYIEDERFDSFIKDIEEEHGKGYLGKHVTARYLEEIVERAREDFFTNPNYGDFKIINETLFLEDLESTFDRYYDTWKPFRILTVDYICLMQSTEGKGTQEIAAQASKKIKAYLTSGRSESILGLFPWQIKTSALLEYKKTHEMPELYTADSAEGYKTSDKSIVLVFDNEEEKSRNILTLILGAGRKMAHMEPIKVNADYAVCSFKALQGTY